jgi:hypothetical protein
MSAGSSANIAITRGAGFAIGHGAGFAVIPGDAIFALDAFDVESSLR